MNTKSKRKVRRKGKIEDKRSGTHHPLCIPRAALLSWLASGPATMLSWCCGCEETKERGRERESERECDRWRERGDLAEREKEVGGFLIQPENHFREER